jgi:hypothetical protein
MLSMTTFRSSGVCVGEQGRALFANFLMGLGLERSVRNAANITQ